ncbi:hypothetical protein HK097_003912 [Rhizophlyctis rosea]|uniref:Uncharacterized protein n=1 Tax=Rhizophlyctis rosea TaxID=64517 RepID=A0AAD5SF66_9FUNG|nr:hypothetical protein HK097_003912 [Rhizophlyctis rosea]
MQPPTPTPPPYLTNPTHSTIADPETLIHLKSDVLHRQTTFGPSSKTTQHATLAMQHYASAVTAGYKEPKEQEVGGASIPEGELWEKIKMQLNSLESGGGVMGEEREVVRQRLSDAAAALEMAIEEARVEGRLQEVGTGTGSSLIAP